MAHFGKDNLWNPKLQTEGFSYFNMKHNNNGNGINLRERITPAVVMRRVMWCAQKRTVWPMFLGMGITLYLVASIPLTEEMRKESKYANRAEILKKGHH